MNKVYVQGPAYYDMTARVFKKYEYEIVNTIDESDIVVLTGGDDISPHLYNQKPLSCTYYNEHRDRVDLKAVQEGIDKKKFMVGVCRGAQLLNVVPPNSGSMFQDCDNHTSGYHDTFDAIEGKNYNLISVHHQMMIPSDKATIVAYANEATYKENDNRYVENEGHDIEVLWYQESKSLCFQAHPEFGHDETSKYFFSLMDRYYHAS